MTDTPRCSSCGLPLDAQGFCPACLLRMGMAAGDRVRPPAGVADPSGLPVTVGPYRLVEPIGEGGMGVVYLAEQQRPIQRRVALKVIKLGMNTREVVARFEAERQALAMMEHPNIASALDAGITPDGRPYFVMEYVDGRPITEYCDGRGLDTRRRVSLFLQVCAAVQHAHQKGIIHRDLKPSNVLVTEVDGQPVPKVIDFGIAKATDQRLSEQTAFTQHGVLVGTPEYMSPEQADPVTRDIDTRTDVYSLGVILYELLAGAVPFDPTELRQRSFAELQRIIREVEPPRPSTRLRDSSHAVPAAHGRSLATVLRQPSELSGDLDWITLKALEKDRNRRYATVSELAADITRYLHHEPVVARPPSVTYRVQKFVRRNRVAVAAAAVVILAITAGFVVSSAMYVREGRARREAVTERERADAAGRVAATRAESEARQRAIAEAARRAEEEARGREAVQRAAAVQALASAERNLYAVNVDLADRELPLHNIAHVDQLLRTCPAALREWEWHHLWNASHMDVATIDAPAGANAISFSADGTRLLVETNELRIATWDARTLRPSRTVPLDMSRGTVDRVVLSADGTSIAGKNTSPGFARLLQVWDTATGQRRFAEEGAFFDLVFTPDGRRIVTTSLVGTGPTDGKLRVRVKARDAFTGREIADFGEIVSVGAGIAVNADASRVAAVLDQAVTGGKPDIRILDPEQGRSPVVLSGAREMDWVGAFGFSHDGTRFAAGGSDAKGPILRVWNPVDGTEVRTLRYEQSVKALAFSPNDRLIAVALADFTLRLVECATGRELQYLVGHQADVTHLAFTADGARVASAAGDGTVRVWRIDGGQPVPRTLSIGDGSAVSAANVSPDGRTLVAFTSSRGAAAATGPAVEKLDGWDLTSGEHLFTITPPAGRLVKPFYFRAAFSPDSRLLVLPAVEGESPANPQHPPAYRVQVLDARSGRLVATLQEVPAGPEGAAGQRAVIGADIDFSVASDRIVVRQLWRVTPKPGTPPDRAFQGRLDIWNATTGSRIGTMGVLDGMILKSAPSPDGAHAALAIIGMSSGMVRPTFAVRWYELATGRLIRTFEDTGDLAYMNAGGFATPLFTADGRTMAAPLDRSIGIWDVATGRRRATLPGRGAELYGYAFSADGSRLVSATVADGAVKLWNPLTGAQILPLHAAAGQCTIREVILAGSTAGEIRKQVSIRFSEDGRQIVQTTTMKDPAGMKVQIVTWDGSPRGR